ncbi:MAG: hypothetical protein KatS3mg084_0539 [Candidatus Dojkabacteria bacterium]|nr:MAG: hypothetical protein KatS3mg084_0539 [Candidatus Dojkabacteria bacterium]
MKLSTNKNKQTRYTSIKNDFKNLLGLFRRISPRPTTKNGKFAHRISRRVGSSSNTSRLKLLFFRLSIFLTLTALFLFLFGILFLLAVISMYSRDLPNIDTYIEKSRNLGKETILYDRNGQELYRLRGDLVNERLTYEEVPEKLEYAILAAEDANFRSHKGLNMFGLARAFSCVAINYLRSQTTESCPGGSSITQQLIKNVTARNEKNFERKIREMVLAMRIEEEYTKDQILEFYMNILPQGREYVGLKTGAIYLFGKSDLRQLTLAEIAYLTGIPNNPEVFSPRGSIYDPEKSRERAKYVLDRMYEERAWTKVTFEEIEAAKAELPNVRFVDDEINMKAPHFVNYVISELDKEYKDKVPEGKRGSDYFRDKGYKIITTVDLSTQQLLEKILKERIESQEFQNQNGAQNGAGVVIDNDSGEILAMVGSRDYYWDGPTDKRFSPKFNSATSPRSMGSSVKPILYMTAFTKGYHPSSILPNLPLDQRPEGSSRQYIPFNSTRVFMGVRDHRTGRADFITIRQSLSYSLNQPAVSMINIIGVDAFADMYVKLTGNESIRANFTGPSATLGAANIPLLEQVHAYSTIADMGMYKPLKYILEIRDDKDNVVLDNKEVKRRRVVDAKFAYLITDLNENYATFPGSPSIREIRKTTDFAGKTGTSDNSTGGVGDIVFIGYTPDVTVGMWAGNSCGPEECPLKPTASSDRFIDQVYGYFMREYVKTLPPSRFKRNVEGVRRVEICSFTGNAASEDCNKAGGSIIQDIAADTALPKPEFMIEKVSVTQCGDKLKFAREIDKLAGLAEERYYVRYDKLFARKFLADQVYAYITDGLNVFGRLWQVPNPMPTAMCDIDRSLTPPTIIIHTPTPDAEYNTTSNLNVTATVTSNLPLEKVEVALDGVIQKVFLPGEAIELLIPSESLSVGPHTIQVIARTKQGMESTSTVSFKVISAMTPSPSPP